MLTAYLVGDRQVIARLSAMPETLRAGIGRAVLYLALQLQRKVQSEKLTGQVLKVQTGSLRSSINFKVSQDATRITASVGTNIRYAGIHEFGGRTAPHAILPKRGRALAFPWNGTSVVVARVNHPGSKFPERSFLRSALAEFAPEIKTGIETAVREGIR